MFSWSRDCLVATISPLFAYRGIGYCFETGVSINELRVWNEHVFAGFNAEKGTRYSLFQKLVQFVDRISFSDGLNKALRYGLFKVFGIKYGIPHLIPASLLHFFPTPKNNINTVNFFEILEKNGVRFVRKEPRLNRSETDLIKKVPELLRSVDFVFLKLNSLDRIGHKYGPSSQEVKQRVKYFDKLLKTFIRRLDDNTALIVMSDHGMVPTFETYDLIGLLEKRGYKYGRDYMAFVGATYTSFWFKNSEIKQAIEKELGSLEFGKILTPSDKTKLCMKDLSIEFGDTIFLNMAHKVTFPEFYHRRNAPAGMHGYAFSEYDNSIFIFHQSNVAGGQNIGSINFVDIMPTILQFFDLPIPSHAKGRVIS